MRVLSAQLAAFMKVPAPQLTSYALPIAHSSFVVRLAFALQIGDAGAAASAADGASSTTPPFCTTPAIPNSASPATTTAKVRATESFPILRMSRCTGS